MQLRASGAGKATTASATELNTKSDTASDSTQLDFPFQLIKSETIPPVPTRPESAIDWLPEYLGHAWIAYAASSLLVISHFPSPSQSSETAVDPLFRQVIELSSDGSGDVSAVSWSPAAMACGEVAVSLDNCIGVFSHNSEGSFCWSQNAILVQTTNIEAIKWTGSGDGLISVGINVVLWRKNDQSWEIYWKFKPEFPQSLVSTTSSIDDLFATAPLNNNNPTSVLICHGKSKNIKTELHHHVPVSMIQWRPLVANQWKENLKQPLKLVLLTCCADGTVRLWSEIDDGRAKKPSKAQNGPSFRVSATIEINQAVNGVLGSDVFVRWATELDGIVNIGQQNSQYFPSEDYHFGKSGKCDWLICFGPKMLVTFWAVHCIDDFSPLRFPRVTLWKKQQLPGFKTEASFPLYKSVISRNGFFSPPAVSSVVHLLPNNHLIWSQFYKNTSSQDSVFSIANGTININGHTRKILQIAVHPHGSYPALAASLDTNGMILFWSIAGFSPLNSGCKLSGHFVSQDSECKYTSLKWAPLRIDDHRVLLMGYARGIDCFSVKISENEELISCHKLFTIDFTDDNGPTGPNIWSIPLTSNKFMVLAIWGKGRFQALSWNITINSSEIGSYSFESDFSGKFPDAYEHDKVTSFAVMNLFTANYVAYHMVTGCLDGSLKLWKSMDQEWELVGMISAHVGPITRVSVTDCGRKIATLSSNNDSNDHTTLHIWESVYLGGKGSFLLEETINLDEKVVALSWLTIGNGQLLFGICLQNEVRIYSMKRINSEKNKDTNMWFCLAKSQIRTPIRDFIWGPEATFLIVHDDYFCLFSQWLLPNNKNHMSKCMIPEIYSDPDTHEFGKCPTKINMENCVFSRTDTEIDFGSILELAARVGGSLPTYHPEALLVNIYSGNWKRARSALEHLFEHLTSNNTKSSPKIPQIGLSNYIEGISSANVNNNTFTSSSFQLDSFSYSSWDSNGSTNLTSTRSKLSQLADSLKELQDFSAINEVEKMQILAVIDLLDEISNSSASSPYVGLDEAGRRFWVAVRFQQLYCVRKLGNLPSVGELTIDSTLISWAFHSDCQETLFESFLNNDSSWNEMRNMGIGFWYTNQSQLRIKMERLAKQQYLKTRDPKACALLYIALNRLQVLAGLFKISKDEKDKPLVAFLSRNFQDEKNKAAALKNAYVLMGKHQLELAVAFFLLGGDIASAVNVCTKTLGDEQLALVICRLLEGHNGHSEHHLISKILLSSSYENGDYWKSSFLEWVLGNYSKAFLSMLGDQVNFSSNKFAILSNHAAFKDPNVGQYCIMLANKNQMKNSMGEQNTLILGRWAILMSSTALNRCGLPVEALECLSSSLTTVSGSSLEPKFLNEKLNPFSSSSNWVSADVALHMLSHAKHNFAMQYITNLLMEHPSWPENATSASEIQQYNTHLSAFENKLNTGIAYFEQKYSLISHNLINMIIVDLYNHGLMFIGCHILQHKHFSLYKRPYYPSLPIIVSRAIEDFSYLFSRYNFMGNSCYRLSSCRIYIKDLLQLASKIRNGLKLLCGNYAENVNILQINLFILNLCEYYIYSASAWFQKDFRSLTLVLKPILLTCSNKSVSFETNMENLNQNLPEISERVMNFDQNGPHEIPENDKWQIIRASFWGLMSGFLKQQINSLPENFEENINYSVFSSSDNDGKKTQLQLVAVILIKLLKLESEQALSYCAKQLASYLLQRVKDQDQSNESTFLWLEDLCRSTPITNHQGLGQGVDFDFSRVMNNENGLSDFELLWSVFNDHKTLCGDFAVEYSKWSQLIKQKHCRGWIDAYASITGVPHEDFGIGNQEIVDHSVDHIPFEKPKQVHKINGELFEALCINSIDQQQAAIATNKKGIIFFNLEEGQSQTSFDKSNYIWTDVEWPTDGWAGSESTPVPTFVSPGIGLGSKKGTHLGLGGATIGVGLTRPVNTTNLGWEIQDDFEEFIDPPATVANIRTRAFSSHPSRPFFLVGSSNTHVYLWEFGKTRATATYGVLPAANVPPPYALASISAVQFDNCGQRFATAALDGTVCTWQLEVGGRSNVCPTESSLCFNNYTSDVTYVTSSGSIVAAVGYSSNNVNVVIWDTLAPPTTSRASIMCHEGGARSICVFANDIGSGSVSPLIVTGGKGGDVGVHDFRYIATGRPKLNNNNNNNNNNNVANSRLSFGCGKLKNLLLDDHTNIFSMSEKYIYMRTTFRRRLAFGKSAIHGFGIFAKQPHKAGDMVIEYTGEIVRPSIADRREHLIYNSLVGAGTYMFRIDEERVIDATRAGSIAHLINHSCEPNCYSRVISVNGDEHIIIFAKRDIAQWEELTYDYRFFSIDERLPCYCGFPSCRGVVNDIDADAQMAKLYAPRSELTEWQGE